MILRCLESWISMNSIKENKKDIYVIYFWPDTEALCINLRNILKKTERVKVSTNLIVILFYLIIEKVRVKI